MPAVISSVKYINRDVAFVLYEIMSVNVTKRAEGK